MKQERPNQVTKAPQEAVPIREANSPEIEAPEVLPVFASSTTRTRGANPVMRALQPGDILNLQRTIGNQATRRIIARQLEQKKKPSTALNPVKTGLPVQRIISYDDLTKQIETAAKEAGEGEQNNIDSGEGTAAEVKELGAKWVGEGATETNYPTSPEGKFFTTADGKKQYRPPMYKRAVKKHQCNYEFKNTPGKGKWSVDAHITVTDYDTAYPKPK
jgi:hypothetical protein